MRASPPTTVDDLVSIFARVGVATINFLCELRGVGSSALVVVEVLVEDTDVCLLAISSGDEIVSSSNLSDFLGDVLGFVEDSEFTTVFAGLRGDSFK